MGFKGSLKVNITCATPDAVIHYTTDGSAPDLLSPVYDPANFTPFTVTTILKAYAIREGYAASPIVTGTYTSNPNEAALPGLFLGELNNNRLVVNDIVGWDQSAYNFQNYVQFIVDNQEDVNLTVSGMKPSSPLYLDVLDASGTNVIFAGANKGKGPIIWSGSSVVSGYLLRERLSPNATVSFS